MCGSADMCCCCRIDARLLSCVDCFEDFVLSTCFLRSLVVSSSKHVCQSPLHASIWSHTRLFLCYETWCWMTLTFSSWIRFENYRISNLRTESDTSIYFSRYFLMKSLSEKKTLESIATNQLPRHNLDFQLQIQWLVVNRFGVLLNSHLSGNSKFVFSSYQSRWEIRLTSAGT